MAELKWPKDTCDCGANLKEQVPTQEEKGRDVAGNLIWNCHCRRCGRGYQVGMREEVKPQSIGIPTTLVEQKAAKEQAAAAKTPILPPEPQKDGIKAETGISSPEPKQPLEIPPSMFWCTKCHMTHRENSKFGRGHKKYAAKTEVESAITS